MQNNTSTAAAALTAAALSYVNATGRALAAALTARDDAAAALEAAQKLADDAEVTHRLAGATYFNIEMTVAAPVEADPLTELFGNAQTIGGQPD
jgi:hypothetical protein